MPSVFAPDAYDAVLFDLDGVLTSTRTLHAAAWKRAFDEFLHAWDARHGTRSPAFDEKADYAAYVDGKPRQDGVRELFDDGLEGRRLEGHTVDPGAVARRVLRTEDRVVLGPDEAAIGQVPAPEDAHEVEVQGNDERHDARGAYAADTVGESR